MAEPIQIQVEFTGAQEAARAADTVSGRLDNMSTRTEAASRSAQDLAARQTAAATAAIAFGQRLAAAANAIQGVASALGVEGQAAGLLGKITQTSAAMAQLGATFGPQGALVGGIVGAAIPAIQGFISVTDQQVESMREAAVAAREEQQAQEALTDRILGQLAARRQVQAQMRGEGFASPEAARQAATTAQATISDLEAMVERLRRTGQQLGVDTSERIRGLEDRIARERGLLAGATQAEQSLVSRAEEAAPARRGGGGRRRAETPQAAAVDEGDAMAVVRDIIAEQNAALREQAEIMEQLNRLKDEAQTKDAQLAQQRAEEAAAELERQSELKDALIESTDKQREVADRQRQEYQAVTGVIVGGLNDALQSIISGQKTAGEAFEGLLASFLKYISEQSMLKAIFEYAEAIASFASYKYDQGVQHLAAGVAYTAVAVAAGAGAVALAQPSGGAQGEQKPASPEAGAAGEGGRGGDVVINWNSPVVTAGTRAELGRDMASMIRAGSQRFGTV